MKNRKKSSRGVHSDIELLAVLHARSIEGIQYTQSNLAKDCNLSERRLRDVLQRLTAAGVISETPGAGRTPAKYTFTGVYHGSYDGWPVVYVSPYDERFLVIECPGWSTEIMPEFDKV